MGDQTYKVRNRVGDSNVRRIQGREDRVNIEDFVKQTRIKSVYK